MTEEYTPTTDEVREWFVGNDGPEFAAEFDRWLAAHDRAVKAETLREAAEDAGPSLSDGVSGHTSTYSVRKWLRACADQIEGEKA